MFSLGEGNNPHPRSATGQALALSRERERGLDSRPRLHGGRLYAGMTVVGIGHSHGI